MNAQKAHCFKHADYISDQLVKKQRIKMFDIY